jgi:hypothetical protein
MSAQIKNLFEKGLFDEVISNTENSFDSEDLLFRILSLEALYRYDEALNNYYIHREAVENWDLISSCKALMFILIYFKKDDEIIKETEHFKNMPYVNQQTEEFMQKLNDYIKSIKEYFYNSKDNNESNLAQIKEALFNGNNEEQLYAIKKIFDLEAQGISCKVLVVDYLKTKSDFNTNYALLLEYAIFAKVQERLIFKKDGKYFSIIPMDYSAYLISINDLLHSKLEYMKMTEKNVSIIRYISILARPTFMYLLPEKIQENDIDNMLAALVIEGSKMYGADITEDDYLKNLNFSDKKVKEFQKIISIVQNEF